MSLATRCPSCKTIFKINEDLLKAHSGMVRCGICRNVFNGIDSLVGRIPQKEPPEPAIPAKPAEPSKPVEPAAAALPPAGDVRPDKNASEETLKAAFDSQLITISLDLEDGSITFPDTAEPQEKPAEKSAVQKSEEAIKAAVASHAVPVSLNVHEGAISFPGEKNDTPAKEAAPAVPAESKAPDPVKAADPVPAKAPARTPEKAPAPAPAPAAKTQKADIPLKTAKTKKKSGIFWVIGSIVLIVVLCGQAIYFYSDKIISVMPGMESVTAPICRALSCPSSSEKVSISGGFSFRYEKLAAVQGEPGKFVQQGVLKNTRSVLMPWPLMELEVLDAKDNVLARRILKPENYLAEEFAGSDALAPSVEIPVRIVFTFENASAAKSRITIIPNL